MVLCVLSMPGRPALSVRNDHTVAIIMKDAPYPSASGSVSMGAHMSCGISTRNIASGCTRHMAQAFLRSAPRVVV